MRRGKTAKEIMGSGKYRSNFLVVLQKKPQVL